ncbi:MAG: hypothetical protein ACJAZS_000061 [Alteromonas naphthalenivorans]|jgi:hypothetical protein
MENEMKKFLFLSLLIVAVSVQSADIPEIPSPKDILGSERYEGTIDYVVPMGKKIGMNHRKHIEREYVKGWNAQMNKKKLSNSWREDMSSIAWQGWLDAQEHKWHRNFELLNELKEKVEEVI